MQRFMSSLFITFASAAFAPFAVSAIHQACDITLQNDVEWPAINETITLKHEVSTDENGIARHNAFMVFSDGHALDLKMGTMCLEYELTGCQEMALRLHENLKDGLNGPFYYGSRQFKHMGEFAALLDNEEFCAQPLLPYLKERYNTDKGQKELLNIKESATWLADYVHCNPVLENIGFLDGQVDGMDKAVFERLAAQNAPLINVPYAYGAETYVFDPERRELILLSTSGC